ncbi:MarR family winged helix-turn-helix transcriptional regulator [Herbiconiux sp. 11R-BC]|uniref:MarR family transcriptional regulator n=1 Tax=Herbiconiux sp. 11R-BC TaxID=3111637 RepID=UPI003C0C2982
MIESNATEHATPPATPAAASGTGASAADCAADFDDAFRRVYLAFHRRDGVRRDISPASRAVLMHLAHSGPITIGEASAHFARSQSAVSELVTQLESNRLVERRHDDSDRRRTLIWLMDAGRAELRRDASVLSHELLEPAILRLGAGEIERALGILNALVTASAPEPRAKGHHHDQL